MKVLSFDAPPLHVAAFRQEVIIVVSGEDGAAVGQAVAGMLASYPSAVERHVNTSDGVATVQVVSKVPKEMLQNAP